MNERDRSAEACRPGMTPARIARRYGVGRSEVLAESRHDFLTNVCPAFTQATDPTVHDEGRGRMFVQRLEKELR